MTPKDTIFNKKTTLNCSGRLVDLYAPKVMGILNVTPDSFYDGGRYLDEDKMLEQVQKMIQEGAFIIDIGACSSKPGAENVDKETEIKRLVPALKLIRNFFPETLISIDTFRSEVAKLAIQDYKADMVNDVSAGDLDPTMFKTIVKLNVPYCIMHMQGTPQNMQQQPVYQNVVVDIIQYFATKVDQLKQLGQNDIIIDPGFGFGKTLDHNYELLKKLDSFKIFELPLMVGVSRKSMIWKLLGTSAQKALNGTTALHILALQGGATILRTHDVAEAVETIRIFEKISQY